jgi:NADH:ubiquinone oxidoreductase subunit 5 (chain L)/Multisubunit Na+/H+ antiporter, MnhA subunit
MATMRSRTSLHGFVTVPLVLLAIPSVVVGFLFIQPMLFGDFFKNVIFVDAAKHPAMAELAEMFHGPVAMALHSLQTAPFWLALAGVALSYYMYMVNPALPAGIKARVQPLYALLENKYYLDWINENILARGARALGVGLWKGRRPSHHRWCVGERVPGKIVGARGPVWCAGCSRALSSTTRWS